MLWSGQENTIKKTIIWPWGQSPTKVITVRDTPPCPYGRAPTYQISLTYLERQKCYGPDKKIVILLVFKKLYLTLRSTVKVPRRSLRYVTHRLMVMYPYNKYNWPISKDKNAMARTRKYYLKNNYLTLRSKSHEGHYGMRHTALWSCTHIPNKYYLKNNYLTLRSKVKVPRKSIRYATHHLMVMHPHTKYHWPILKDKNVMARTRKYYLKNNYLTLRSKVKVP
jgi:hypothetical protein